MKKMKKLFAILMTMAMVMGLGITGFAAETTGVTVTVSNTEEADLYVKQIVVANTSNPDGWEYVPGYKLNNLTIAQLAGIVNSSNGDASTGALTSSVELAAALESLRTSIQVNENKIEGNSFDANLGGLYVVIPVEEGYTYSPTLVYVPVGSQANQTVQTKGAKDQITKSISSDGQSVAAGDIVQYTVTVEYPYISANYTNATFTITDTLTNGTFLINDTYQVVISDGISGDVSPNANGTSSLTISFNNYDKTKAGIKFTISYYVTVSDTVSSDDALENEVKSSLKLDPSGTPIETESKVITKPVKTKLVKVDEDTPSDKLSGAKFSLYEGQAADYNTALKNGDTSTFVPIRVNIETGTNGEIIIDGLDVQEDYFIVETQAPEGYQLRTDAIQLTAPVDRDDPDKTEGYDKEGVWTVTYSYSDFGSEGITTVTNTTLAALPSTGGMGTTLFTIAGCVIMISAAGLFFATRKKAN